MAGALRFKNTNVDRQPGERARLKVIQGPDQGAIYVLTAPRVAIGRGENCEVMVSDLKASRKHAELIESATGWTLVDAGSANGVVVDGKVAKESALKTGSIFSLGETTMEIVVADEATQFLKAPAKSISEISQQRAVVQQQRNKVQSVGQFGSVGEVISGLKGGSAGGATGGSNENRRKILIYGAALGAALLLFSEDENKANKKRKVDQAKTNAEKTVGRDLAQFLPNPNDSLNNVTPEVKYTARVFFSAGFREFNNRNWLRAKRQFENVLQVDPGHRKARLYLNNCESEIKQEIKFHREQGARSASLGRLRKAKGHYESVIRLLFFDRSNPAYVEAEEKLQALASQIKGEDTT